MYAHLSVPNAFTCLTDAFKWKVLPHGCACALFQHTSMPEIMGIARSRSLHSETFVVLEVLAICNTMPSFQADHEVSSSSHRMSEQC